MNPRLHLRRYGVLVVVLLTLCFLVMIATAQESSVSQSSQASFRVDSAPSDTQKINFQAAATPTLVQAPTSVPIPPLAQSPTPASSVPGTIFTDNYAVIAPNDVTGLIDAINIANSRSTLAPIYQAYLTGTSYNVSALPIIRGSIKIYGRQEKTVLQVSTRNNVFINNTGNAEFHHVQLTNNSNPQGVLYGGAVVMSGKLGLFDSIVRDTSAISGGGGIVLSAPTAFLTLERVKFERANAGGGAAIQVEFGGEIQATCVEFANNTGDYGRALLVGNAGSVGGTAYFRFAAFYNSPQAQDVINLLPTSRVTIDQSWWESGRREVNAQVRVIAPQSTNPISRAECVTQLAQPAPTPMPPPPTNTPRPTRTFEPTNTPPPTNTPRPSPTATVTLFPTPTNCQVTIAASVNAAVRLDPALDVADKNVLFRINSENAIISPNTQPYLWPGGVVPTLPPAAPLDVIAYVGVVAWIGDIEWVQVQLRGTNIVGYIGLRSGTTTLATAPCVTGTPPSLPNPALPGFPRISAGQFAGLPVGPVFGRNSYGQAVIPSAVMGACGLHLGTAGCTPPQPGSTIDIIPKNLEFCIDTRAAEPLNLLSECDGSGPIFVYAPVSGQIIAYPDTTFSIKIDVGVTPSPSQPARQINFAHVRLKLPANSIVTVGEKIGELCTDVDKKTCKIDDSTVPTHLAFQPRNEVRPGVFSQITPATDVLGLLAIPTCLFDDWVGRNGSPTRHSPQSQFAVCP